MWLWLWLLPWISAVKIDIEKGTDGAGKWINASAEEGLQKGTILLSLAGAFRWPGLTRQFSIQSQDADLFEVTQSGEIALTRNLDFEELCAAQPCNVDSKVQLFYSNSKSYHVTWGHDGDIESHAHFANQGANYELIGNRKNDVPEARAGCIKISQAKFFLINHVKNAPFSYPI